MSDCEQRLSELPNWIGHFEWRYIRGQYNPCTVLDFGCGYGFSDIYLAQDGFRVFGYDSSPTRVEVAKCILSNQTIETQSRVQFSNDGFPKMDYDLVWSSHVFEHIPYSEWRGIFASLPKCEMLISVPLGYAYDMPEHIHHWATCDELLVSLKEYSDRQWEMSSDLDNRVIRAKGIL